MPAMSLGQISEIATMAGLGYFLKRLGWRRIMIFGILGHVVRFAIYALGGPRVAGGRQQPRPRLLLRVLLRLRLHLRGREVPAGLARERPGPLQLPHPRPRPVRRQPALGQARRRLPLAGGGVDFSRLFLVPAGIGLVAAIMLFLGFHPDKTEPAVTAKAA